MRGVRRGTAIEGNTHGPSGGQEDRHHRSGECIGRAATALMVTEDASVLIADLDHDATVATAAEICEGDTEGRAAGIPVDVTDEG